MASEQDKERLRRRAHKQMRHLISREEELQRRQAGKARRAAGQRPPPPRAHGEWDEEDDPGEPFAPMRRQRRRPAARPDSGPVPVDLPQATVTAVHQGRVDLDGVPARIGTRLLLDRAFRLVVGDRVVFQPTAGPPRVVGVLPRRSVLSRPDPGNPHRTLVLVANVDLAVIVVAAADPPLRPGLIDRYLLALAEGGVAPLVCVNKVDLLPSAADPDLQAQLSPYRDLAVPLVCCSAGTGAGIAELRGHLRGRTCVFVGHSGVGKSSLLNAMDPAGDRAVGDVQVRTGKGRHTTTGSQLWDLGDDTRVIDTPGIRAFGLDGLAPEQVRVGFADLAALARDCRFADCWHGDEPGCAVRAAAAADAAIGARHASYRRILASLAD